ncbi:uncharacterized [Tachysurus ichikawai]
MLRSSLWVCVCSVTVVCFRSASVMFRSVRFSRAFLCRRTLALLSPPSLFPFNSHLALRLALKPRAASFTPPFYILDIDTGCKSRLTGRDL